MANVDAEHSSSYSAFERFLIWFLIPFVFTSVLLGVLLAIFDSDIKNDVLGMMNKVPVLNKIIPDPQTKEASKTSSENTDQQANKTKDELLAQANQKLAEMESELKQAEAAIQQRDQTIKELQAKNSELDEKFKQKTQSEEEYTNQIQQLANMYAKMNPSKSAPILENLTPQEQVLVLGMMKQDDRVKILEKMDPKKAADASIMLKDQITVRDREIAALQERLKQSGTADSKSNQKLTRDDLGSTFASMTPKSAATVLLEMQNSNPDKVISILSSMDNQARSKIIASMSESSKETAALIAARLAQ
jgi:flagellar motility protein MotE (MotC chaperone)